MITVNAWLAALPVRGKSAHHQLFTALKRDGQDWSESSHVRKVQFTVTHGHIVARMNQQPSSIPCKPVSLAVNSGDTFQIQVRIAGQMPSRTFQGGRKEKARDYTPEEMDTHVRKMLERLGEVSDFSLIPGDSTPIHKGTRILTTVTAWELSAKIVIADESAFAAAWSQGLGRFKTYGFGMIREKKL